MRKIRGLGVLAIWGPPQNIGQSKALDSRRKIALWRDPVLFLFHTDPLRLLAEQLLPTRDLLHKKTPRAWPRLYLSLPPSFWLPSVPFGVTSSHLHLFKERTFLVSASLQVRCKLRGAALCYRAAAQRQTDSLAIRRSSHKQGNSFPGADRSSISFFPVFYVSART